MSEETEAGSGAETDRESPGRILKAAREKKGLSIEELAAETLLSADILGALEADDFEYLSQAVFVRGYYRKCAKILGLSEDELLAAYVSRAKPGEALPATPAQLSGIPQDVTPHSWRGLGLILAALLVLLALLGVWWLTPAADGDYTTQGEVGGDTERVVPTVAAEPDDDAVEEAPPPPTDEANESGAQLRLRFNQRSWVEVRDASGKRLLEGMPPAGSERVVGGSPPYEIMLGNAPGVEIRLDGERVVFDDRVRGDNTARLTVTRDAE